MADSDPTKNIDYNPETSVSEAHDTVVSSAASREKPEPVTGQEPLSLWLILIWAGVLLVGGGYLAAHTGGFQMGNTHSIAGYSPTPRPLDDDNVEQGDPLELWLKSGEKVFKGNCAACHMANGKGQAGAFPPLAGSEYVTGGTDRIALIILNGIAGKLTVMGAEYNGNMQAWKETLNDKQIAQVMSYIRSSWGNDANLVNPEQKIITAEMVAKAREKYADKAAQATEADVKDLNDDLELIAGKPLAADEGEAPSETPAQ